MRITRIALAAILTLGVVTVGQTSANAEPSVSTPSDFWFICC